MTGELDRISIISVVSNAKDADLIGAAITSAVNAANEVGLEPEVLLVSNNAPIEVLDRAVAAYPRARVMANPDNPGFGAACNQAFAEASGQAWLLLNPDAVLNLGSVRLLADHMRSHPRAAAIGPSIGGPGHVESAGMLPGIRSMAAHFFLLNRILGAALGGPWRGFALARVVSSDPVQVEWSTGAALLLRASAIREVGGFDPSIFLYGDDIELCSRLNRDWETWLVPAAKATHLIAASQGRISTLWVDGLHDLYGRAASTTDVLVFDLVLSLGLLIRAAVGLFKRGDEERIHQRQMAAGGRRAARLSWLTLIGRRGTEAYRVRQDPALIARQFPNRLGRFES
jgi:GT2 family glycosyltransferase